MAFQASARERLGSEFIACSDALEKFALQPLIFLQAGKIDRLFKRSNKGQEENYKGKDTDTISWTILN